MTYESPSEVVGAKDENFSQPSVTRGYAPVPLSDHSLGLRHLMVKSFSLKPIGEPRLLRNIYQ